MSKNKGRVARVSVDLDSQIRELAKKNNLKYIEASEELARMTRRFSGRKVFREIKF